MISTLYVLEKQFRDQKKSFHGYKPTLKYKKLLLKSFELTGNRIVDNLVALQSNYDQLNAIFCMVTHK